MHTHQSTGILCSSPFSLQETLGKAVTIRAWVINKLPNDAVSIENAIMLERSNRWPLMIDPQVIDDDYDDDGGRDGGRVGTAPINKGMNAG